MEKLQIRIVATKEWWNTY